MADQQFDVDFHQRFQKVAPISGPGDEALQVLRNQMPDVLRSYADVKVVPIGSTTTGVCLKDSDLDVVVILGDNIYDPKNILEKIDVAFRQGGSMFSYCKSVDVIDATVPILDIKWNSGLEIQMSVAGSNGDKHDGIRNSHLLMHYFAYDERAKQLGLVVKMWAKHHDLIGGKDQKLNSYCLCLYVIFYLQQSLGGRDAILPILQESHPSTFTNDNIVLSREDYIKIEGLRSPNERSDTTLRSLVKGFFEFYANFNFKMEVASVRTGKKLDRDYCANNVLIKETDHDHDNWYKEFCIEDPFTRTNVARSAVNLYNADRTKTVFKETHRRLSISGTFDSIFY